MKVAVKSVPKSRLAWVDAARGLGIVLVVFGHVTFGLMSADIASEDGYLSVAVNRIYAFHMPLFFFLSGLFVKDKLRSAFREFLSQLMRNVVYPYVVWASLQICVQALLSRFTNAPASFSDLLTIFTQPSRQFWFLYVLALVKCVHWLLVRALSSDAAVLVASLVLHAVVCQILPGVWSPIVLTFYYLPLVTCATVLAPHAYLLSRFSRLWCVVGALVCFAFVSPYVPFDHSFLSPSAVAGVVGVVLVASAISPSGEADEMAPSWGRFLRMLGAASLEIYVAHTLASAGFRIVLKQAGITNVSVHLIGGTLVGILFPLALIRVAEKANFHYLFTLRKREPRFPAPSTPA